METDQFDSKYEFQQTKRDREILKEYVEKIQPPNCYLEVGCHHGGSALYVSKYTERPVFSVDNLDKLGDDILCERSFNFILGNSTDVVKLWKRPIEVLFIDGDHTKASDDFYAWESKVVSGGYILFHDYIQHSEWTVTKDCENIIQNTQGKYDLVSRPDMDKDGTTILILKKK